VKDGVWSSSVQASVEQLGAAIASERGPAESSSRVAMCAPSAGRGADRAFRCRFSMRGRARPRPNLAGVRDATDDLEAMNFGAATEPPPPAWRVEYLFE